MRDVTGVYIEGERVDKAKRPIENHGQRLCLNDIFALAEPMSRRELAERLGVSERTLSKWRNEPENSLTWEGFKAIAVTVREVLNERGELGQKVANLNLSKGSWLSTNVTWIAEDRGAWEDRATRGSARLNAILNVFYLLDDERKDALELIAFDMMRSQEVEQGHDLPATTEEAANEPMPIYVPFVEAYPYLFD